MIWTSHERRVVPPSAPHGKTAVFGIVALFGLQVIMLSVLRFERSPFYVHIVGVPDCDVFVMVRLIMFTTESGAVVRHRELHCGKFIIWLRPRLKAHRCDIGRLFFRCLALSSRKEWFQQVPTTGFAHTVMPPSRLERVSSCTSRLSTWKSRTLLVSIAPNSSVSNRTWKHTRRSAYTRQKASDV